MKFFAIAVFAFAIGCINALPTATDEDLGQTVKRIIDNILDILPETLGVTDIGIVIPENDLIRGSLNIDEISVTGFKKPNVETVTYDDATSRLDYELNFEDFHVVVDFSLVLEGIVDLTHHFSAVLDLSNVDGKGFALVNHDPKEVTDFSILISLDKIDADIKGLLNDDDLSKQVSDEITQNGAQVVDKALADISPAVSSFIKDFINIILKIAACPQ